MPGALYRHGVHLLRIDDLRSLREPGLRGQLPHRSHAEGSGNLGIVNNDKEKCIGCMTCEKSCPYGHPVQLDDGLSHKCVLCSDENPEGVPDPTCAKACPVRALEFGTLAELRERHPEGVSALGELTDETAPAVVFAPHRDAAKGGVLRNPQEVSHEA